MRRHLAGEVPVSLLKARANAASDSYPTSSATDATGARPPRSRPAAASMRQRAKYCIGGRPSNLRKRAQKTERDMPAARARSSIVQ